MTWWPSVSTRQGPQSRLPQTRRQDRKKRSRSCTAISYLASNQDGISRMLQGKLLATPGWQLDGNGPYSRFTSSRIGMIDCLAVMVLFIHCHRRKDWRVGAAVTWPLLCCTRTHDPWPGGALRGQSRRRAKLTRNRGRSMQGFN